MVLKETFRMNLTTTILLICMPSGMCRSVEQIVDCENRMQFACRQVCVAW